MCREQNIIGRTTPLLITIKKRLKVPGQCTFYSDRSEHEMGANVRVLFFSRDSIAI